MESRGISLGKKTKTKNKKNEQTNTIAISIYTGILFSEIKVK